MFNRDLKRRIEGLEKRIKKLENPFMFQINQKVTHYRFSSTSPSLIIVDRYRDKLGYPVYSLYSEGTGLDEYVKEYEIYIHKDEDKNEHTEA